MKILAQDPAEQALEGVVPSEQEQEVQQGTWEIDEIKHWTPGQVSVIVQKPLEEISTTP